MEAIRIPNKGVGMEIRQLQERDAEDMFRVIDRNREHLSQHHDPTARKYPSVEAVLDSIRNPETPAKLRCGIWVRGVFVGTVNLKLSDTPGCKEIGYWIGKEFGGKGFATEAARALSDYALENPMTDQIIGHVVFENTASRKALERAGFMPDPHRDVHGLVVYRKYKK